MWNGSHTFTPHTQRNVLKGEIIKAAQEKPGHQEGRAFGLQSTTGAMKGMTGDLCDPWEGADGMTSEEGILGGFLPHRDGPLLRNKLSAGHARNPRNTLESKRFKFLIK